MIKISITKNGLRVDMKMSIKDFKTVGLKQVEKYINSLNNEDHKTVGRVEVK